MDKSDERENEAFLAALFGAPTPSSPDVDREAIAARHGVEPDQLVGETSAELEASAAAVAAVRGQREERERDAGPATPLIDERLGLTPIAPNEMNAEQRLLAAPSKYEALVRSLHPPSHDEGGGTE